MSALADKLERLRARVRRLRDEADCLRGTGRDALALRLDDERRRTEIEAGHVAHALAQLGRAA